MCAGLDDAVEQDDVLGHRSTSDSFARGQSYQY